MTNWTRVKNWRGFGIIALVYIALWFYFLIAVYLPWSDGVLHGGQSWFPLSLPWSVAMFFFLILGLLGLPGGFYVVWSNLLRKRNRKA